ncbi:MAG: hypothetical protein A2X49_13715 [Lentisphaerae bacterium GWF2_52_8]|nr:MAG: hypothetical protein A2X49_13715 [Lentisphaerae bacterium GWF2_52_8]
MAFYYNLYSASLLLAGLVLGTAALLAWRLRPESQASAERLPRNVFIGAPLALAALIWCIPHTKPLLSASWHVYLWPLAFFLAFLASKFIDYLFARALGGFCILLAHYLLSCEFTFHTPLGPLFSIFVYVMGIFGIVLSGWPYLFRELIRALCRDLRWRKGVALFAAAYGLLCLGLGVVQFIRGPLNGG